MRLTTDQLRSLARLLEPQFQTVEQRRHVLQLAFEDRPGVTRGINLGAATPEQFALNLLNHLQGLDSGADNGHSALGQLLDCVVEETTGDGSGLAEALIVYRARLDMPEAIQGLDESDADTTAPHPSASLDDTLPTPAAERPAQGKAMSGALPERQPAWRQPEAPPPGPERATLHGPAPAAVTSAGRSSACITASAGRSNGSWCWWR